MPAEVLCISQLFQRFHCLFLSPFPFVVDSFFPRLQIFENPVQRVGLSSQFSSSPLDLEFSSHMASTLAPRPLLLKDFLLDDPYSCSADDFQTSPGRCDSNTTIVRELLEIDLSAGDPHSARLHRSRSKAAAATTISAFQKVTEAVINAAVKLLPFSSVKSPSSSSSNQGILRRSFSRNLSRSFRKKSQREVQENRGKIRVRDIVRWRSFADEEEKKQKQKKNEKPLDATFFSSSITTTTSSSSGRSSWSESDFTLRSSSGSSVYSGENEGYDGKNDSAEKNRSRRSTVGGDSTETATCCGERKGNGMEGKGGSRSPYEDKEQLSPVSVLDFPDEDEEAPSSSSSFQQSLANMERTKQQLLQKIRRFECLAELDPIDLEKRIAQSELEDEQDINDSWEEEDEDKSMHLLKRFKAIYGDNSQKRNTDRLLIDFFREGLSCTHERQKNNDDDELEKELVSVATDWMNGFGATVVGVEDTREAQVKEMERGERWKKFEEDGGELAVELEVGVFGSLLEELLLDLLS